MCTRGSRGLAPGEPWPALKERPSASERRAVGAGLRLVWISVKWHCHSQNPLIVTLYRDGIFYFIYMFCTFYIPTLFINTEIINTSDIYGKHRGILTTYFIADFSMSCTVSYPRRFCSTFATPVATEALSQYQTFDGYALLINLVTESGTRVKGAPGLKKKTRGRFFSFLDFRWTN